MNRLLPSLRFFLNLALAALLGYTLVQTAFSFNATPQPPTQPLPVVNTTSTLSNAVPVDRINIAPILAAQLFGAPPAVTAPPPVPVTLPETRLNFKLQGIYYTAEQEDARAIINTGNTPAKTYKVGDNLPNNVTLHKIESHSVILQRNGQYETLRLIGTQPNDKNPILNSDLNTAPAPHSLLQSPPSAPTDAITPNELSPAQLLGQYQQRLSSNPQSLMNLIRAAPVNENGQFIGYRISPGQDQALFDKFGLQHGDIVTAVNGITLDNPLKGFKVLEQVANARQLSLQVNRSGRVMDLQFAIE
jgi:general secretion pathway protein C